MIHAKVTIIKKVDFPLGWTFYERYILGGNISALYFLGCMVIYCIEDTHDNLFWYLDLKICRFMLTYLNFHYLKWCCLRQWKGVLSTGRNELAVILLHTFIFGFISLCWGTIAFGASLSILPCLENWCHSESLWLLWYLGSHYPVYIIANFISWKDHFYSPNLVGFLHAFLGCIICCSLVQHPYICFLINCLCGKASGGFLFLEKWPSCLLGTSFALSV